MQWAALFFPGIAVRAAGCNLADAGPPPPIVRDIGLQGDQVIHLLNLDEMRLARRSPSLTIDVWK